MRPLLLVGFVHAACGGGGYRAAPPAHAALPDCSVEGTLVEIAATDAELSSAPIAIAWVHRSFSASDVTALWADGTLELRQRHRRIRGRIPVADATAIARRIVGGLARAPDYAERSGPTDATRIEMLARDGTGFRHTLVWGASPSKYNDGPAGFVDAYRALQEISPVTLESLPADAPLRGEHLVDRLLDCAERG